MARPLNKAVIKARVKANKIIMKDSKKVLTDAMTAATKGGTIDAVSTRASLASFIKASKALNVDNAKLVSIESDGE